MKKLNLVCLLIFSVLILKSQNEIFHSHFNSSELDWIYTCGGKLEAADTLTFSHDLLDSIALTEFIVSDNDTIWRSNDGPLEWVTYYCGGGSNITSGNDTLIVSPNPFDSLAVIEFTISNNDSIWLDIYSVTGNSVKSYYNGTILSSGSYTLNFNGDTLPNGIYFVRLKNSLTTIQTVKLIKSSSAVGLKESALIENISIFPNPTSSIINIIDAQGQLQNSAVEIRDYLGQTVYTSSFTSQISVSDLSAGIYYFNIHDRSFKKTIKIIKQ